MSEQLTVLEGLMPYYKIDKPIRLIELFAGIGSQHEALKRIGFNIDGVKICEWSAQSTQAYNDIHIGDNHDYSKTLTKDELVNALLGFGVSIDWKSPLSKEQLSRKSHAWLAKIYNNFIATNNLGDIQRVTGASLNIVDEDNYTYIMTYSFPCQDLSLAGNRQGMARGGSTRSGLLWEVERILKECYPRPHILLMENVPEVVGRQNINHFLEWEATLTTLGYSNYFEVLNAADYGIPQSRNRAFMVSILGDYLYAFPPKQKLTRRLRDILEQHVAEKYYLTEEQLQGIRGWKAQQDPLKDIEKEKTVAPTLTARGAGEHHSGMILISEPKIEVVANLDVSQEKDGRVYGIDGIAPTINTMGGGNREPKIVDRLYAKRDEREYEETAPSLRAERSGLDVIETSLRIRKLTTKECWRLMGFNDDQHDRVAENQGNSTLYHLAGDSIVVDVLVAIFNQLKGETK